MFSTTKAGVAVITWWKNEEENLKGTAEMMGRFYAHSIEGKPKGEWQGLEAHLKWTAELAKSFADEFSSGN